MTDDTRPVETAIIAVRDETNTEILTLYRTYKGAPDQALGYELAWLFTHAEIQDECLSSDVERWRQGAMISCGMMDFATDLVSVLNATKPGGQNYHPRLWGLLVYAPGTRNQGEVWTYQLSHPAPGLLRLSIDCLGCNVWNGDALAFNPKHKKWNDVRSEIMASADSGRDQASDRSQRHDATGNLGRHGNPSREGRVLDFLRFKQARHSKA